ncbi:MAG: C-terminal helicase domain-containing protein, partial [Cyanobacteriota bacterium]|nr:C-terminal helicase domain-containing protein [Cyanobacteriota bacterium]
AQRLLDMLGLDYFTLLDQLTIARSRKHIEKYYGTEETGRFPEKRQPINIRADVDRSGAFPPIGEINDEIRRLHLAAYAPLRYVLPHKQRIYDEKYSTIVKGGTGLFRQQDREESLIQLMRVNVLKRMESSVASFALTLARQLQDVERLLARIKQEGGEVEDLDITAIDLGDPALESLVLGRKVKVLLQDVDRIRWQQDLGEDQQRLASLLQAAEGVTAERDAKLAALRAMIRQKAREPINPGNRKLLVFTAFADTARYLYAQLAPWAQRELGLHLALVTGTGRNQTTRQGQERDLASILTAFAPRAKERPAALAGEGELDLLIATDCLSEGQNLQDCDWLINYDIHWNPLRIIQRFGRIDRIGSPNASIQLANFWPNLELEDYINLEQRVSGRMVLLDLSATGEDNLIEPTAGKAMNDLDYRRAQLLRLRETAMDLEELGTGLSITDLTLTDGRRALAAHGKAHPDQIERLPPGTFAVVSAAEVECPAGIIFCLRAEGGARERIHDSRYPFAPHYLVHVAEEGTILLPHTRARRILERLKAVCHGREQPDWRAWARFERATRQGEDMRQVQRLLAAAVASVVGKSEERAVASLFAPGGTHALAGEFAGINDFEVVAFLVVLPEEAP